MIRTLTFTTLFPNAAQPTHGVFVENRLLRLLRSGEVTTEVLAPVPWFPWRWRVFGEYARYAEVPAVETRGGVRVEHPRYLVLPKVGMHTTPHLLFRAAARRLRHMVARGFTFDLIDAHYFYPDGVAATWLGQRFGKPVVITGRGTDLNLIPQFARPRQLIRAAANAAAGIVTVCAALREPLVELGIAPDRVTVLRNGVDLEVFVPPVDRAAARKALGLTRPTVLSVGHLIPRKAHDLAIRAIAELRDVDLLIVGDGPERRALEALVAALGLGARVRFLGRKPHDELPGIYGAVDAMILASSREGWANVLLESMACGTPVVASAIWGTPEVVATPAAGALVQERTPVAFAAALRQLLAEPPARAATRRHAEGFSWDDTTRGQLELFRSILAARPAPARV